jgi:hypothetical protein
MRTTLDLDTDVLEAAKERARREGKTAGQVISELLRQALTMPGSRKAVEASAVHGFRPFTDGQRIVTNATIDELRLDDNY